MPPAMSSMVSLLSRAWRRVVSALLWRCRGQFKKTHLLAEGGDLLLNTDHVERLGVPDNWGDKTLGGGNSNADVDKVTVDDGVAAVGALNRGVDSGDLLHGEGGGLGESAHEAELGAGLLEDLILVELAHLHKTRHVDLVESGERGGSVLGLLQALGDPQAHAVHLDAALLAATRGGGF